MFRVYFRLRTPAKQMRSKQIQRWEVYGELRLQTDSSADLTYSRSSLPSGQVIADTSCVMSRQASRIF